MKLFKKLSISNYLKEYIRQLPKGGRGEVSRLARHLQVSTTLISQILAGDKVFTPEQVQSLVGYLGLTPLEADYMTFLVQYERAGNKDLKNYWRGKLEEIKNKSLQVINRVTTDRTLSEEEKVQFYSSALYSAIRLYCTTSADGRSVDEVCERFDLSRSVANEMLQFLTSAQFCIEKNGKFLMGLQKTHTPFGSPHTVRHHMNWRVKALQYADKVNEQELMYTAPISLSRKDFESLREEMVVFIKNFLKQVHASSSEEVACLNLDFFWVRK